MAPRAVADTNVLIAAAISPHGTCGRLLEAAIEGHWDVVASPHLLDELSTVLRRDKFRRWLSLAEANRFGADIAALAEVVSDPAPAVKARTPDLKDEYLLVLAQATDVVALVSGDPDLTDLADTRPSVLTPAAFLARLSLCS